MGNRRQIQPLGKILADQAVGILVGRPLPGAVRIGEIDVNLDALGQDLVTRHLPALIVSQRLFHGERDMAELAREAFQCGLGRAVTQLDQHQVTALALHKGAHGAAIARPLDVIPFPVPRYEAGRNLYRALVDGGHVRQRAAPVLAPCAGHSRLVGEAQLGDQFAAQLAPWQGIDGAVDRLVRDMQARIVGVHPPQSARNLFRRPTLRHQGTNPVQQQGACLQLDRPTPPAHQRRMSCARCIVALPNGVARHFARHRGGRSVESSGNCRKTPPLIDTPVDLIAFVHRQLTVVISHAYTLPNWGVALQSRARRPFGHDLPTSCIC